jgi:hypothetical protein
MATLLHIHCSPRSNQSASGNVAQHFVTSYRASHPRDTVLCLNLWEMDLPEPPRAQSPAPMISSASRTWPGRMMWLSSASANSFASAYIASARAGCGAARSAIS